MNETKRLFEGMGVALVSPFLPSGEIDYTSLERLLRHVREGGADFVVVHGTTGESPCLSRDERNEVTRFVVEQLEGQIPIVIGLGGNNTREVAQRMQEMQCEGLCGILSVVPYYNKPTQEGLYRHFATLAEHSPLPIILYNVPGRSATNMMPETVLRLSKAYSNIVGIKEASGFVAQGEAIHNLVERDDFTILSGDDNLSIDFIRNGARGVISVVGNAYPKLFTELIHLSLRGQYNEAELLQAQLRDINTALFANGNPSGIKALLYQQGIISHNTLRLPLVPVSPEVYLQLEIAHQKVSAFIASRQ